MLTYKLTHEQKAQVRLLANLAASTLKRSKEVKSMGLCPNYNEGISLGFRLSAKSTAFHFHFANIK